MEKRQEIEALIKADILKNPWRPLINIEHPDIPTPQRQAYDSEADVLLYGGSAGGGKTDLICGLALTRHRNSLILRREYKQLTAMVERMHTIRRTKKGYSSHPGHRWRVPETMFERVIRMDGVQHEGDEKAFQGQPHDLYAFDELTQFTEGQFRYIITWNRSSDPSQRCRVVAASNPPDEAEGEWVIRYWAPWLDENHPNPALPGELRWFISDEQGKDLEVDGPDDTRMINGTEMTPKSRTFIPSAVDDNPFLMASGYKVTLMSLPEPLRSKMLQGDFTAGRKDNPWQVIPTEWIKAAQSRWKPEGYRGKRMSALGVDVAQGGENETILVPRYEEWYGELEAHPGRDTPESAITAGLVLAALKHGACAVVDADGVGGETYGHLNGQGVNCFAVKGNEKSVGHSKDTRLPFFNKRSEYWWRFREALDPAAEYPIALPPDSQLRADLAAPRWSTTPRGIKVESKPDIIKRLGRSPDRGDACIYASVDRPALREGRRRGEVRVEGVSNYDPQGI